LEAFEENKIVISSQEERISMLRLALENKGLVSHDNPHYDLPGTTSNISNPVSQPAAALLSTPTPTANMIETQPEPDEEEGIFL